MGIENIRSDDSVFESAAFAPDAATFNLVYMIKGYEGGLRAGLGSSAFVIQNKPSYPMWIWNCDAAGRETMDALLSLAGDTLKSNSTLEVICKDEIAHEIRERFGRYVTEQGGMNAYACRKPRPVCARGSAGRATLAEAELIAKYISQMEYDIHKRTLDPAELVPGAVKLAQNPGFAVWRDEAGEIAAMSLLNPVDHGFERINTVFTRRDMRGHGYAPALVCSLCEKALADGALPVLYADSNYPSSNRAYLKAGFECVGHLSNISMAVNAAL